MLFVVLLRWGLPLLPKPLEGHSAGYGVLFWHSYLVLGALAPGWEFAPARRPAARLATEFVDAVTPGCEFATTIVSSVAVVGVVGVGVLSVIPRLIDNTDCPRFRGCCLAEISWNVISSGLTNMIKSNLEGLGLWSEDGGRDWVESIGYILSLSRALDESH